MLTAFTVQVHRLASEGELCETDRSFAKVQKEFDLQSIAYAFARALEVEFVGGPGTFWCLAYFTERHLVPGGAHALAHMVSEGWLQYWQRVIAVACEEERIRWSMWSACVLFGSQRWLQCLSCCCMQKGENKMVDMKCLCAILESEMVCHHLRPCCV